MTKPKAQTADQSEQLFSSMLQGLNNEAYVAAQRRTMDALTHSAQLMSDAAGTILNQQLDLARGLGATPTMPSALSGDAQDIGTAAHNQFHHGRSMLEHAIKNWRSINDTALKCYFDVCQELETCAEENMRDLGNGLKPVSLEETEKKPAAPAQKSEKLRSVSA